MDAKKFAMASVAGGVMLFLLGFVLYGVLLSEFMEANMTPGVAKEMPDMVPLILGELVLAAFLTLILSRWSGIESFGAGAKAGALLGLLLGLGLNLELYGTMNLSGPATIPVDTLINAVRMGLTGGVIGVVLGRL